jgi:hypothetical protein
MQKRDLLQSESDTSIKADKENAFIIQDSISDYPEVLSAIQKAYNIEGEFIKATHEGDAGEKCDVRVVFHNRHIDASIKAYGKFAFNQITRCSIDTFAQRFSLSNSDREQLRELVLHKSMNARDPLFPPRVQERWRRILEPSIEEIIKDSFSETPNQEILVLYDKIQSIMRIWKMEDVLSGIENTMIYTSKGNIQIGGCVGLQRKGGNGVHITVPASDPSHPGNNMQTKLQITNFIELHKAKMLAEYQVEVCKYLC